MQLFWLQKLQQLQQRLAENDEQIKAYEQAKIDAERKVQAESEARTEAEQKLSELEQIAVSSDMKGQCDCCGSVDISVDKLVRIDSGHLFCPECLTALRTA